MGHEKIKYNGKALSLSEQIILLKERGIVIQDENVVAKHLSYVGFYRLFSYIKPLQNNNNNNVKFEKMLQDV